MVLHDILLCTFTICNDKSFEKEKSRTLRPVVGSLRPSGVLEGAFRDSSKIRYRLTFTVISSAKTH